MSVFVSSGQRSAVRGGQGAHTFARSRRPLGSDPNYPGVSRPIPSSARRSDSRQLPNGQLFLCKSHVPSSARDGQMDRPFQPLPVRGILADACEGTAGHQDLVESFLATAGMSWMDGVKFFFQHCNTLALCYEVSSDGFDVIDSSTPLSLPISSVCPTLQHQKRCRPETPLVSVQS